MVRHSLTILHPTLKNFVSSRQQWKYLLRDPIIQTGGTPCRAKWKSVV